MSETRGLLQAILDSLTKEDVKFGPKGKPRKELSELEARKKAEKEGYASIDTTE